MASGKENLHQGHRKRMREAVICQNDFNVLHDHQLLEVLLFYGIPRRDTNPIAHELLNTFGSIAGVLDAEIHDLAAVKGMTENAAFLIKTVLPIARRYQDNKYSSGYKFANMDEVGEYLIKKYFAIKNETFGVLCLDNVGGFAGFEFVGQGTSDVVGVSVREIVAAALKRNAPCVIAVHNHFGSAMPSREDIDMTVYLRDALAPLGIRLLDHMIIAGDDYISMRQSAEFTSIFK